MAIQHRRDEDDVTEPELDEDGDAAAVRDLRRQAGSTPALGADELDVLLQRWAAGDQASRQRIVAAHLRLVIQLAEERQDHGLSLPDLIQEGSLGLVEAVTAFSGCGAVAFSALAAQKIRAQIDVAIAAEAAAVRDADLLVTAATDYERTSLLLRRELNRPPTEADLAEKLEWTVERTRYVAQVVAEARRRHDEDLLAFIDPEAIDFDHDERPEFDA